MRKLIGVAAIVFMISALAMAGEAPKPEIYGGYQFTSTDGGWHGSGFNTGANLYLTRWLAGTADFGSGFSSGRSFTVTPLGQRSRPRGRTSLHLRTLCLAALMLPLVRSALVGWP